MIGGSRGGKGGKEGGVKGKGRGREKYREGRRRERGGGKREKANLDVSVKDLLSVKEFNAAYDFVSNRT